MDDKLHTPLLILSRIIWVNTKTKYSNSITMSFISPNLTQEIHFSLDNCFILTVLHSNYMEWSLCSSVEGHEWGVWEVRRITWMEKISGKYLSSYLSGSWLESSGTPYCSTTWERAALAKSLRPQDISEASGLPKGLLQSSKSLQ